MVFCCNHRGWADFGIDGELTGAPYLSRWVIFFVFPFTSLLSLPDGGIVFCPRRPCWGG